MGRGEVPRLPPAVPGTEESVASSGQPSLSSLGSLRFRFQNLYSSLEELVFAYFVLKQKYKLENVVKLKKKGGKERRFAQCGVLHTYGLHRRLRQELLGLGVSGQPGQYSVILFCHLHTEKRKDMETYIQFPEAT